MYQHPVPQNVTSYQFRLIGNMTIRQFAEIGIGIGIAVLIYITNLPSALKWLLIAASTAFGFALAFLPIEDRPLDQWVIAYLKAIYRPTQYMWQKNNKEPKYFSHKASQTVDQVQLMIDNKHIQQRKKEQGLNTFMKTINSYQQNNLTGVETSHLQQINQLFANSSSTNYIKTQSTTIQEQTTQPQQTQTPPKIVKKTHPITAHPPSSYKTNTLPFPSTPNTPNTIVGMVLTKEKQILDNAVIEIRDNTNTPVRATKTNKLGQFFSSTPLKNGTYQIYIEKQPYNFDIISLNLDGNIIEPLAIQAKA